VARSAREDSDTLGSVRVSLMLVLLGGCRFGFDEVGREQVAIELSRPIVLPCDRSDVTLTIRDGDAPRIGADVELTLSGTSAGTFAPVIDQGDGRYMSSFTGAVAGTESEIVVKVDGVAVEIPTTTLDVDDLPSAGLRFSLDATRSSGTCATPSGAGWVDVAGAVTGQLIFVDPTCTGSSGWCGAGTPDDPYRLALDGASGYVDFGPVVATADYTVAAWVRPRGTGVPTTTGTGGIQLEPILSKGAADLEVVDKDTNYVLGITPARTLGTDFERDPDSLNQPFVGTGTLSDATWQHVAVTYDRAIRRLYIDGALDGEQAETEMPSNALLSRVCVGAACKFDTTPLGQFSGDIASIVVYDHALDATELRALCDAHVSRFAGAACQ
jgi:hypothetical protein